MNLTTGQHSGASLSIQRWSEAPLTQDKRDPQANKDFRAMDQVMTTLYLNNHLFEFLHGAELATTSLTAKAIYVICDQTANNQLKKLAVTRPASMPIYACVHLAHLPHITDQFLTQLDPPYPAEHMNTFRQDLAENKSVASIDEQLLSNVTKPHPDNKTNFQLFCFLIDRNLIHASKKVLRNVNSMSIADSSMEKSINKLKALIYTGKTDTAISLMDAVTICIYRSMFAVDLIDAVTKGNADPSYIDTAIQFIEDSPHGDIVPEFSTALVNAVIAGKATQTRIDTALRLMKEAGYGNKQQPPIFSILVFSTTLLDAVIKGKADPSNIDIAIQYTEKVEPFFREPFVKHLVPSIIKGDIDARYINDAIRLMKDVKYDGKQDQWHLRFADQLIDAVVSGKVDKSIIDHAISIIKKVNDPGWSYRIVEKLLKAVVDGKTDPTKIDDVILLIDTIPYPDYRSRMATILQRAISIGQTPSSKTEDTIRLMEDVTDSKQIWQFTDILIDTVLAGKTDTGKIDTAIRFIRKTESWIKGGWKAPLCCKLLDNVASGKMAPIRLFDAIALLVNSDDSDSRRYFNQQIEHVLNYDSVVQTLQTTTDKGLLIDCASYLSSVSKIQGANQILARLESLRTVSSMAKKLAGARINDALIQAVHKRSAQTPSTATVPESHPSP
ncbi:hypothetical protein HOH87_00295 [bacterium]|nr:hypothetical protein [bacterium]